MESKKSNIILSLILLFVVAVSCSNENKTCEKKQKVTIEPINPNGNSELALLMRKMFYDLDSIKTKLNSVDLKNLYSSHEAILTAEGTEPDKVASPEYKAFAKVYLQFLKNYETADPDQKKEAYHSLVQSCLTCHQSLCPGPMVRIKKLF